MSSSAETYLETFCESMQILPYHVRRNMELIADLDKSYVQIQQKLTEAETAFTSKAERIINEFPLPIHDQEEVVVVPTTEELRGFVVNDAKELENISALRQHAAQLVEEKILVAQQTLTMIQRMMKTLDGTLSDFETKLRNSGDIINTSSTAMDTTTAVPIKQSSNNNNNTISGRVSSTSSVQQQQKQHQSTKFGLRANDQCAIKIETEASNGVGDWILAKVLSFNADTGMYKVSDEDPHEAEAKTFTLPESQVSVIGRGLEYLKKGDTVLAIYPDTTAFYHAHISQPPRKIAGSSAGPENNPASMFVMVKFVDDSDEFGVTHDKPVLLAHVMRMPANH